MRTNQPKGPRFPDVNMEQVQFNKAIIEILKQEYRERTALSSRITKLEEKMIIVERKNIEGSRPPSRYFMIMEDI